MSTKKQLQKENDRLRLQNDSLRGQNVEFKTHAQLMEERVKAAAAPPAPPPPPPAPARNEARDTYEELKRTNPYLAAEFGLNNQAAIWPESAK